MGIFQFDWDEAQQAAFSTISNSSEKTIFAFIIVSVHYVVAQWIWCSSRYATREIDEIPPRFHIVLPLCMMWIFYCIMMSIDTFQSLGRENTILKVVNMVLVFGGFLLNLAFFSLSKVMGWEKSSNEKEESTIDMEVPIVETAVEENNEIAPLTEKKKKTSVLYINNIKIFLTHMVILYHIVIPNGLGIPLYSYALAPDKPTWATMFHALFLETNKGYFMSCFFFYSGYFVPKSYDKKGVYIFLFERIKRLGIPWVVYSFILGPYARIGLADSLMRDDGPPYYYMFHSGDVTWFLASLIGMNLFYSLLCGKGWHPKVPFPGIPKLLAIGLVMGIITSTLNLFVPGTTSIFGTVRFFFDGPYFFCGFFGGALAMRNNWLEELQKISQKAKYILYASSLFFVIGNALILQRFGFSLFGFDSGIGIFYLRNSIFVNGVATVYWNLAVTLFFMEFMNKKYWCTDFSSKAMYTAYIIQFLPMVIAFYLWVQILRSLGVDITYTLYERVAVYPAEYCFPGFLFMGFVTTLINWPVAYLISSIPGFSQVL